MYQMISHTRFDLQVMPTSQHLWLGNNLPGQDTFSWRLFFCCCWFHSIPFHSMLLLSFHVHRCVFMFHSVFFIFVFCFRSLLGTIHWRVCGVFFWSVCLAFLHVIKCTKCKKKHTKIRALCILRKNENKHLRQIYTLWAGYVVRMATYQPNNSAWQQQQNKNKNTPFK